MSMWVLCNRPSDFLHSSDTAKIGCNETVYQLFIDFKKAYNSVKWEVLYRTFIQFGAPIKIFKLVKMCLNEMFSKVCIGKHSSDSFPIQNCLKQGDALFPQLFSFALEYTIRKWDTSASDLC
jgi:hypothetical protein